MRKITTNGWHVIDLDGDTCPNCNERRVNVEKVIHAGIGIEYFATCRRCFCSWEIVEMEDDEK